MDAALREVREETGLTDFKIVCKHGDPAGNAWRVGYDGVPTISA
ncbi:MAG: hypothetical protein ACRDSR_23540 [Pseudonocardiaceae bacterium]